MQRVESGVLHGHADIAALEQAGLDVPRRSNSRATVHDPDSGNRNAGARTIAAAEPSSRLAPNFRRCKNTCTDRGAPNDR